MGRKNSGYKSINKKNLKTAGIIILLGSFLLILLLYKSRGETSDADVLIREENGKKQSIKLVAESEYGEEDIEIELLSRTYSEEEIVNMKENFLDELKTRNFENVLIFAHGGVLACARVYAGLCDLRHAFENLIPFGGMLCIEIYLRIEN